ncbi:MAG TPA: amidase, partial [Gemmatimonas sp.]|uniref:amidase n=1 Tax=Gemmatimonas sp. TaxID=1962908 RepID=UPI002ED87D65
EPAVAHTPVLTRLLAAGATMVGKTHTEEMTFSLTGENAHYGTPINPAAPDRVPGGSSSGSASAVAGGLVDFAIGSDTGGSVRAPASFCGIYGIRPTHGRISLQGACPLAPMFDTCGWFARDAALLGRLGRVLFDTPAQAQEPGALLYAADAFAHTMPGVDDALMPAVSRVSGVVGALKPVTVSPDGLPAWYEVFRVLQFAEIWQTHGAWVREVQPTFGPQIAPRFDAASKVTAEEVATMTAARVRIQQRLDTLLADNAVMVLPTVPGSAPLRGLPLSETVVVRERSLALLCIAGLGGLPQVSLPMGTIDGCPVGLSLIASRGNDEMLLDLAERIAAS